MKRTFAIILAAVGAAGLFGGLVYVVLLVELVVPPLSECVDRERYFEGR